MERIGASCKEFLEKGSLYIVSTLAMKYWWGVPVITDEG
jgi:hypothetical protein